MTDKFQTAQRLSAAIVAVAAVLVLGPVAQGQQTGKFSSLPAGAGVAGNWAHFLGPNYNGVPTVARFDPQGIKRVWSHELGPGCSSVTILEGRLYTMGNRNDQDLIYCLDPLTGEEKWKVAVDCRLMANNYEGGPSSTPTVADGRLYAFSRNGQVRCLDARDGRQIWASSVAKWSPKGAWWGFADSPIVWEDRVFLNVTEKGLAINRETGEIVWSGREAVPSYATILPLPRGNPALDRPALLVQTCHNLDIIDPDTGASLLGQLPDWAKRQSNNNAVTPAVFRNSLIFMHGKHGLSKVSCKGGRWVEDWLCKELVYNDWDWFTFNQQVIRDGHLIALAGRGTKASDRMTCVDLETGQVKWRTPKPFGNLVLAADKLVTITQAGEVAWGVLDGIHYKEMFREKLLDGRYWAHPVLHNGCLYVRSNQGTLTCLRFETAPHEGRAFDFSDPIAVIRGPTPEEAKILSQPPAVQPGNSDAEAAKTHLPLLFPSPTARGRKWGRVLIIDF